MEIITSALGIEWDSCMNHMFIIKNVGINYKVFNIKAFLGVLSNRLEVSELIRI